MAQRRIGCFFYNIFLALAGLILLPVIIFRFVTGYPASGISFKKQDGSSLKPTLWIHATTEGQLSVIDGIFEQLTSFFTGYQVVLTYTGKSVVNVGKPLDSSLMLVVLPYSVEFCAAKILSHFKPKLLLMVEDPLYPNLVHRCKAAGIKVALIGGRVNRRLLSVHRLAPEFIKSVLKGIDLLMMDSVAEANKIGKLGATLSKILVSRAIGYQGDDGNDDDDDDSLKEAFGAIGSLLGRNS